MSTAVLSATNTGLTNGVINAIHCCRDRKNSLQWGMHTQVIDHEGVLFEVQYEPDPAPTAEVPIGPKILSVLLLGPDYRPVGPNLVFLFDKMFFLVSQAEGTKFLSMVADQCKVI